jgi:hypothetical protein
LRFKALRDNGDALGSVDIDDVTFLVVAPVQYGIRRHRLDIFQAKMKNEGEKADGVGSVFL